MKIDASLVQSMNLQGLMDKYKLSINPDTGYVDDDDGVLERFLTVEVEKKDKMDFEGGNLITQDVLASLRARLSPGLILDPPTDAGRRATDVPLAAVRVLSSARPPSIDVSKAAWEFCLAQQEYSSKWYKNALENGNISQEEYERRIAGLNQNYDEAFGRYHYMNVPFSYDDGVLRYDQSPVAADFAVLAEHLADIKARYERGVFGEGEDVLAARVEAWSKHFDALAAGTAKYVTGLFRGFTGGGVFENKLGSQDIAPFLEDIINMYKNAKEHLLAGGSAADLTEEKMGAKYLTMKDIEYLYSDGVKNLILGVTKNFEAYSRLDLEATSRIQGNYEKYFTDMKLAVQSADIGAALKAAILRRASYGLLYKWV
ncbi:MAG: hypothetical protein LBG71_01390 [Clostridiales Family XIII bacterium]|jgi:hypothetical protein|nr:hypothetical protein [Clostridiales Family XIII bacterium]